MKRNLTILFIAAWFCVVAVGGQAQQKGNDKKSRDNAINTNKKTPVQILDILPGSWKIQQVFKGDKEITQTNILGVSDMIDFDREGRYVRYSGNEKIDSGAYRVNEDHGLLYLESVNDGPPSEWKVSFNKTKMTLRKRDDTEQVESFKYVYSKNSTSKNSN